MRYLLLLALLMLTGCEGRIQYSNTPVKPEQPNPVTQDIQQLSLFSSVRRVEYPEVHCFILQNGSDPVAISCVRK